MPALDSCLREAEQTYRKMRELAQKGDSKGKREIVQLRSRYTMLMLDIIEAKKTDPTLQADPDLAREFDKRLNELRNTLSAHQTKWRLLEIEADTDGYMASAATLNRVQDDFYDWARGRFPKP